VVEVTHWAAPGEYWLLWEQRFISAVLTNLTVAPISLLLACGGWRQCRTLPRRHGVEAALLALSILGSSYMAFSPRTVLPRDTPELLYLLVPVLLWAAVRFGVGGISTSLLAVALLAAGWADASGLFVARAPSAAVVTLQLFLIALGAPALCLAGLVKEREDARAEAERQAAQLDRIFEGMADGVVVYDAQGLTVRTNASARRLLGLDAAPPGYNHMPLPERIALYQMRDGQERPVAPEDTPSARALRGEVVTGPQAQDLQLRTLDGRDIEVNSSAAPLLDREGRLVGTVNILRDQTERNQLEREREAARAGELALREVNRHMDQFLATASHDLRTPITGIVMGVEVARRRVQRLAPAVPLPSPPSEGGQPADQRDTLRAALGALELAGEAAQRLSRLIVRLFDVAQARTGILDLKPAAGDLAALVRAEVEAQRALAPERTIRLGLAPDAAVPVVADGDRIGQVVANYLTNALKYAPADRPVEVSLAVQAGQARVAVRDEGPGLPAEEQARVWEPFHRAPNVTAQSNWGGSLGLGLYICKQVVVRHGGEVGVESVVGQGSTFWFTLPLAPQNEIREETSAAPTS
jgi:signal transduction histidine kinase